MPLQFVVPGGQLLTHTPETHESPVAQTLPHPPQLNGSVDVLRQDPLHKLWPCGHTHIPPVHIVPVGQGFPQPPQLLASFWRVVQTPEQLVWPGKQSARQMPLEQT
jgi:hypothetical protein